MRHLIDGQFAEGNADNVRSLVGLIGIERQPDILGAQLRRQLRIQIRAHKAYDQRAAIRQLLAIRQMVTAQRTPPPTPQRSRCVNCEFRRFCNDVV